jgi:hypothetical protein
MAQKLFRMVWMVAIALLPRHLATLLIEQRFIPGRRWQWVTRLVAMRSSIAGSPPVRDVPRESSNHPDLT